MDKNVALAVFLLFLIVADASNGKFRKLAAAPSENKSTSSQVLGQNKPDPKTIDAAAEQGADQVQNNSSQLGLKTDLVSSPPQNQITDNREKLNSMNLGNPRPVQNQIMNDEKNPKDVKNTDDGKNLKSSSGADLTMSNSDRGKVPKHVPGTYLVSPSPGKEKNNGKSGGKDTDSRNILKRANGTDLPSPSQVNEKDKDGKIPKHVKGMDLSSPLPLNEKDNEKSGGNEMDNGKTLKRVHGTDLQSPSPVTEKDEGKNSGTEKDNGKTGRKETDNGKSKVDNGKNDRIEESTIDDKSSSQIKKTDNGKDGGTKEEGTDDRSSSELGVYVTCDGLRKCIDRSALTACIQNFDTGSRQFTVLVQNGGEKTLIVNLTVPTAVESPLKRLKLSKHQAQMINISQSAVENNKLVLSAGNGECVLHTDHPESENVFIYLPSFDKLVTPINGAYFLMLSLLVFTGTWACCKFRKLRWCEGVPYQELEMGLPESVAATNVETAEGWDQGWDDDWDEDNAVKSPATRMGSISANGLTSRSPNRDGWDQDWDD